MSNDDTPVAKLGEASFGSAGFGAARFCPALSDRSDAGRSGEVMGEAWDACCPDVTAAAAAETEGASLHRQSCSHRRLCA